MAEQRIYVPFGEFSPDLSHIGNAEDAGFHLLMVLNAWALGNRGYRPSNDLADLGHSAVAGKPTGSAIFNSDWLYYGNDSGTLVESWLSGLTSTVRYTAPTSGYVTIQSWREDNSGPSFTDITADVNDPGANDAQPFPAGAGADDAVYFGYSTEQTQLTVTVGTAGVGAYSLTWEYSRGGTAWKALSNVVDNTNGFTALGANTVSFSQPEDWQAASVGGVTAFYIRARRDGGGVVTDPILSQVEASFTHTRAWSLTRFGAVVVATNEYDPVQVQLERESAFEDLITSTDKPQAKYVATFGDRLVLGNLKTVATTDLGPLGNYPYSIWYSGRNAANDFDAANAVTRPGFQTLPTRWGEITGLTEVGDYLLIFFERAVYRMSPSGIVVSDFAYLPVVQGRGTRHPRSIRSFGNAAYAWDDGPFTVNASGHLDLGTDKMSEALLLESWPIEVQISVDKTLDVTSVISAVEESSGNVLWSYPSTDSAFDEALLAWNFRTGRFSMPALLQPVAGEANEVALIESRGEVFNQLWSEGSTLVVGIYDSVAGSTTLRRFSNTSPPLGGGEAGATAYVGAARFQLSFLELSAEPIVLLAIQPIISPLSGSSGLPTYSVTIRSKDNPADADPTEVTFTTADSAVDSGWMSLLADVSGSQQSVAAARYHQVDLTVTPTNNWHGAEIQGILLRYEPAGYYGG